MSGGTEPRSGVSGRDTARRDPRRQTAAVIAALVLSLAGAAGCSSSDAPAAAPPPTTTLSPYQQERHDGLNRLLEQWSQALRTGDEQALRALIDPHAAPGFLDAQLALARDLQTVDFAEFGFHLGDDPEVFVPPEIADRLGADDSWGAPVYLDFRLAGVDEAPIHTPVGLIAAHRGDHWTLVSTKELQDGTHPTLPPGPWAFGAVSGTRVPVPGAGESLVLAHPGHESEVEALRGMLPAAISAVADFWGTDWDRSVVVEIADSAEEFSALTGNPADRTDVAAASISLDSDAPGHGQRVVFAPGAVSTMSAQDARMVLQHELSHVAVRTKVGRGAPTWLLEGTADYVAQRPEGGPASPPAPVPLVAAMVSAHGAPDELPKNKDFSGPNASLAYQLARSAVDYIVDAYGEDGLRTVHGALAVGGLDDAAKDKAMQGAVGVNMNSFATGWSDWLGTRFG